MADIPDEFYDKLAAAPPDVAKTVLSRLAAENPMMLAAVHNGAQVWKEKKQAEKEVPWYSAANRGLAKGTSMGFSDELAGLTDAVTQKLYLYAKGVPDTESFTDEYRKARNQWEDVDTKAQLAHPAIYGGTHAAGALATAIAGPSVGSGFTGAIQTGMGYGALNAAGNSDIDLTKGGNVKDLADDVWEGAKTGGAYGAALYPVASTASDIANAIGNKAGSVANEAMASAVGARSVGTKAADKEVNDLGRTILDEGYGYSDIPRIRNPGQRIVANLEPKVEANSEEIATAARDIAQQAKSSGVKLTKSEMGDQIIARNSQNLGKPGYGAETSAIEKAANEFKSFEGQPNDEIYFDEASLLKDKAQSNARYDDSAKYTDKEVARRDSAMQDVAEAQRQYLRDKALEVSPEASNRWDTVNEKASKIQAAFKQAKKAAESLNGPGREPHSMTALAAHILRTRGGAASAVVLNTISKAMSGPAADVAQALAKNPAILGQYAKPLLDAAEKSPEEFEKVHSSLMNTNPTYRKKLEAAKVLHEEE